MLNSKFMSKQLNRFIFIFVFFSICLSNWFLVQGHDSSKLGHNGTSGSGVAAFFYCQCRLCVDNMGRFCKINGACQLINTFLYFSKLKKIIGF